MNPPRARRRWLTLSLRSLLGLVLVLALVLGRWVTAARTQADAVAAILAIDDEANIEYSVGDCGFVGEDPPVTDEQKLAWWIPLWAYRWLGRDYFLTANLVGISLPVEPQARAAAIGHLARLRHLAFLSISTLFTDAEIERLRHRGPASGPTNLPHAITDAEIERLAHLDHLREFSVDSPCSGVTDRALAVLARWPRLEQIRLTTPRITDVGLARLGRLPVLRSIDLEAGGCDIGPFEGMVWTNGGIAWTGRADVEPGAFPALTSLTMHVRLDPGADLRLLGRMAGLTGLSLRGRTIRDDDLRSLGALRNLESLGIDEAALDGSGFRHLAGHPKLAEISIEGPHITDAALPVLARLPRLTMLSLRGSQVTARGLEALQPAPDLTYLHIDPSIACDRGRLKQVLPRCNLN